MELRGSGGEAPIAARGCPEEVWAEEELAFLVETTPVLE